VGRIAELGTICIELAFCYCAARRGHTKNIRHIVFECLIDIIENEIVVSAKSRFEVIGIFGEVTTLVLLAKENLSDRRGDETFTTLLLADEAGYRFFLEYGLEKKLNKNGLSAITSVQAEKQY